MRIKIIEYVSAILVCLSCTNEFVIMSWYPLAIFVYKLFKSNFKAFKILVVFVNLTVIVYIIEYCTTYWTLLFFYITSIVVLNIFCLNYIVAFCKVNIIDSCNVILICNLMSYYCFTIKDFVKLCISFYNLSTYK